MPTTRATGEAERKVILDAALRVMRKSGYAQAQLVAILSEAGLSTRAFYRHFESKDDLLLALYRENAETTAERLRERVADAGSPMERLGAWIDETLSLGYDRRRAARAAVLGSEAARRTEGYADEAARATMALSAPLVDLLVDGRDVGAFPRCVPSQDAGTIHAIVWRLVVESMRGTPAMSEQEARAHARRFSYAALGVADEPPAGEVD